MSLIKDFEIWRLEVPLGRVIGDNNCAYDTINVVALRMRTDSGLVGWGFGESCYKGVFTRPAWYIQPMASLDVLRSAFLGGWWPLFDGEEVAPCKDWLGRWHHAGELSYLDAAAHMAIWDLLAQEAGVPLYQLIGGSPEKNRVYTYGSIVDYPLSEEDATSLARDFVQRGFKTVKVKVGAPALQRDLRRLGAIRDAVGEGIELTIDANEAWTPELTLQRLGEFQAAGFELGYIEDPLPHQDVEGFRRVRAASPIPVVAHDYIHTIEEVSAYCDGAIDRLRCGKDLDFTLKSSEIARAKNIPIILGNSLFEFNVHAAVALPGVDRLEFSNLAWNDVVETPVCFSDGFASAPEVPGHGLVPKQECVGSI